MVSLYKTVIYLNNLTRYLNKLNSIMHALTILQPLEVLERA